jgi:hypothetical protein
LYCPKEKSIDNTTAKRKKDRKNNGQMKKRIDNTKAKRKKKILSSMNKSCETKQQHSQNILHVDVLYSIKRKKYKMACAELAFYHLKTKNNPKQ